MRWIIPVGCVQWKISNSKRHRKIGGVSAYISELEDADLAIIETGFRAFPHTYSSVIFILKYDEKKFIVFYNISVELCD